MAEHNQLIELSKSLSDTYHTTGSDFPNKGGSGMGDKPGYNSLTPSVESARDVEDAGMGESGAGTPTEWQSGGRSAGVARAFPIGKSKGESSESSPTADAFSLSVDLQDGRIDSGSYKATKVMEVADPNVHIG